MSIYDDAANFDLTDEQLEGMAAEELAQRWQVETPEGREFSQLFASSSAAVQKMVQVFELLDEQLSNETLSAAYRRLRETGQLMTEAEQRVAAEEADQRQAEANRVKWGASCSRYIETHSTDEIKARIQSDKAFASYMKQANRLPQLAVEYDVEQLTRQEKELAERKAKESTRDYSDKELVLFAEIYRKTPASEINKQMKVPQFREAVERAAKAGLI